MRITWKAWLGLVLGGASLLSGCGESNLAPPTTVAVRGKVLYRGKPLTGGSIRMEPEAAGREAHASIQPDGTFVLSTYKAEDGAVAGSYRVAVSGAKPLPIRYKNYATSELTVEVEPSKTDYTIELN